MAPTDRPANIALAFIDCDMYSSTRSVLGFLMPRLKHGMIIAFDDYFCWIRRPQPSGERRAMLDFFGDHAAVEPAALHELRLARPVLRRRGQDATRVAVPWPLRRGRIPSHRTSRLPEQSHRRVPGAVAPVEQPAIVRRRRQQQPHGLAERAGQVRHCRVHRDHQVQLCDQAGGVREGVAGCADQSRRLSPCAPSCSGRAPGRYSLLQRVELPAQLEQRRRTAGSARLRCRSFWWPGRA